MNQSSVDLSRGSVGKLLFSLALPSILAQVINVLYNMVDRVYIGHIEGAGPASLTGVGVCMPIIMAVSAFAALVCMGGAPRAAICLGQQDHEGAEKILSSCFSLLLVLALALTIVVEIWGANMLRMFGASEQTLPYGWAYLQIYALGTVFVQLALGLNAFINTQGYAKWGMFSVGIGAILNIVLDPILIFVLDMKVAGAAVATVISQGVSALFCLWFLRSRHSYLHLRRKYMRLSWRVLAPCLLLGLSPFVMQITESLISICFNSSLQRYGGDTAVGAMAILASVMQFSMLPLQGMTQGSQPIISYNFGAGKFGRIRQTFRILLIVCLLYSATLWALCEFAPGLFAGMFTSDEELFAFTCRMLRIYMAGQIVFGAQIACQQTFIALGNAKTSLFLAVLRKIILLIPLIYLLPLFVNSAPEKTLMVFMAEPVADLLAVATTVTLFASFYKRVLSGPEKDGLHSTIA